MTKRGEGIAFAEELIKRHPREVVEVIHDVIKEIKSRAENEKEVVEFIEGMDRFLRLWRM